MSWQYKIEYYLFLQVSRNQDGNYDCDRWTVVLHIYIEQTKIYTADEFLSQHPITKFGWCILNCCFGMPPKKPKNFTLCVKFWKKIETPLADYELL